ncbi:hypothetical protein RJ639_044507 [Escallonia herrerae]|uniref:EF-hand domain-containing protein n=1 Tax=Escallonia herrerae TaxID=1293975 RepID=A0AA89B4K2_9ASTE|nr:hypothetical protein RJ639_044507 [Escallonia herrerae]
MEQLQRIAMAHYQAASDDVQQLAREVFSDMDRDGDGKIDIREFQRFMSTEKGYSCMGNPHFFDRLVDYSRMGNRHFFNRLDTDGNNTLDFPEVMTLFYILKSGRPFCKRCSNFIIDLYFTCVDCFENPDGGFSVCLDCYCSHDINHHHNNGPPRFLDNYTLLEVKKNSDTNQYSTKQVTTVYFDAQLRSQPSTAVGSALGSDGVHRSLSLPSTALGSGSVTNVSYNNTWVYNYGAYHPPPTGPNPSPSTANALDPVNVSSNA